MTEVKDYSNRDVNMGSEAKKFRKGFRYEGLMWTYVPLMIASIMEAIDEIERIAREEGLGWDLGR